MGNILNPIYIYIYRSMDFEAEQIESIDKEYETVDYNLFILTIASELDEDPEPFGVKAIEVIQVNDPCNLGSHLDLIYKDYESYL